MDLNQFENEFKFTTKTMGFYCTSRIYTLLAFQRHKVFKIWIYGLKDMIFPRFKQFLIQILIRNFV
jgi:hypothetical protein